MTFVELATGKVAGEGRDLLWRQGGEDIHFLEKLLTMLCRFGVEVARRHVGAKDVTLRVGQADARLLKVLHDARSDEIPGLGRSYSDPGHGPEMDLVLDTEARGGIHIHLGRRVLQHPFFGKRGLDAREDDAPRPFDGNGEVETELGLETTVSRGAVVVRHHHGADLTVRDHQQRSLPCDQPGRTPAELNDFGELILRTLTSVNENPVTDGERSIGGNGEAGEDIEDHGPQGEPEDEPQHSRGCPEARDGPVEHDTDDRGDGDQHDDDRGDVLHEPRHGPVEGFGHYAVPEENLNNPIDQERGREPDTNLHGVAQNDACSIHRRERQSPEIITRERKDGEDAQDC